MMRADLFFGHAFKILCFEFQLSLIIIIMHSIRTVFKSMQYKCSPRFMYYDMAIWLHQENPKFLGSALYA